MRPEAYDVARRAYERHRLSLAGPWVAAGLLGAAVAYLCGGAAWPLAVGVGLLGGYGRFHGRDIGAGLAGGALFGGVAAAVLLAFSFLGCCDATCGSCSGACAALCAGVGGVGGLSLRPRASSLLSALPLLAVATAVGAVTVGVSWGCAAVAAAAAGATWALRRPWA